MRAAIQIMSTGISIMVLLGIWAFAAQAQPADTLEGTLPEVTIEATRATETEASAPFSVSVLTRSAEALTLEPALSLHSVLRELPGVWMDDRSHFALGERLVIRGMGWRAAFGVRGVQVLLDGIPLTLPDGQAVLDIADPMFVRRAEVIRGPASLFWGNASGGVLFLSTQALADAPRFRARAAGGSHGLRQFAAEANLAQGGNRWQVFASDIQQDGFRDHSDGGFTRAGVHGDVNLGTRSRLKVMGAVARQDTEHPGALTASEVDADRDQADTRFAQSNAGKESTQIQLGTKLMHQTSIGLFSATAYGLTRQLDNPLPFAYIEFDRLVGGARVSLQGRRGLLGWKVGADAGWQQDDRLNWNNDNGRPGDEKDLDQLETVRSAAAFAHLSVPLADRLELTAGARVDQIRFSMDDRLLANDDQSGAETFSAWSPALGLSYRLGPTLIFANYSTAFETPTTTELVNRPDGTGGFNPDLDPQRTRGIEVGVRGGWPEARLRFDVAAYHFGVRDRLIPFETEESEGRTFYRNVGENTHDGVEIAAHWRPASGAEVQLSYTGNRLVFDGTTFDGNRIPGVPEHRLFASLRAQHRGLWGQLAVEAVSDYFVDDANDTQADGYTVVDVNVGHARLPLGPANVQPFLKIGNLFDQHYIDSINVNAFGGRYFDPAPGRTVQAGLNVSL